MFCITRTCVVWHGAWRALQVQLDAMQVRTSSRRDPSSVIETNWLFWSRC